VGWGAGKVSGDEVGAVGRGGGDVFAPAVIMAAEGDDDPSDVSASVGVAGDTTERSFRVTWVWWQGEALYRPGIIAVERTGEPAHAAVGEDAPDHVLPRAPGEQYVGRQDCVSFIAEGGIDRRQLHAWGDQRLRGVAAELVAQIPERLYPNLAVGVHLGPARHAAEVAVSESSRTGEGAAGHPAGAALRGCH